MSSHKAKSPKRDTRKAGKPKGLPIPNVDKRRKRAQVAPGKFEPADRGAPPTSTRQIPWSKTDKQALDKRKIK